MDGFKYEEKKNVLKSLETQQTTTEMVDNKLSDMNKNLQQDWNQKSYNEHKLDFMERYYPKWEANEETEYKERLKEIEQVEIQSSLKGKFDKQEQPKESSYWKTRKNENKKVEEYKKTALPEYKNQLNFGLNTVREMNALDKYSTYHKDYFNTRNHQREYYNDYTGKDKKVIVKDWSKIYAHQMKAHGKFFGALKGTWKGLAQRGAKLLSNFGPDRPMSHTDEIDKGIRPFFSMTKKVLFWKKQVGLLGTETKEERSDGSEYNKRILKEYTENKPGARKKVMDELALKLIKFKLTPNMLTNKYLAANMLQMQRYTDMLNAFVILTQCNPDYLNMKSKEHADPDFAAVIWSRIILLAPIMKGFMEKHARYCGYKKDEKITKKGTIRKYLDQDEIKDGGNTEAGYQQIVEDTWDAIKKAYNSTIDYMDDAAEARMRDKLTELENTATETRKNKEIKKNDSKQVNNKQDQKEENEIMFKYDTEGKLTEELKAVKDSIKNNPQVYDLFGSEINQIFEKLNEQMRRLDEMNARKTAIGELAKEKKLAGEKDIGVAEMELIWRDYINKEKVRIDSETSILEDQIKHYKGAIDFFTNINLKDKDIKLDPLPSVKNVLKYEGLEHIYKLKEAFEYNDLFYKTLDYYDFDKYDNYQDENGKAVPIKDMWAQYNYTLLKRGLDRTRFVNKLVDGVTQKEVKDPQMLNNIKRREEVQSHFAEYEEKYGDPDVSMEEISKITPEELEKEYNITKELDVTKEETFIKFFKLRKIVQICNGIEFERKGPIEYNNLSNQQKIDVRAKGRLLRDYLHIWQGTMDYTKSEAYSYIYATSDMMGNNKVVEGNEKEYRLTTIKGMQEKVQSQIDEIKKKTPDITEADPEYEKYRKLEELNKFLLGMAEANNYDAKEIKQLGRDAYEGYLAEIRKDEKKRVLTNIFNEDYEVLEKNNLAYSWLKGQYLAKIDDAIEIQEQCEMFVKNRQESMSKYGLKLPKHVRNDVDYFTLHFEETKKTREEKKKDLINFKEKFKNILNKIKTQYCKNGKLDDKAILKNIKEVLPDMEFVDSFIIFNHTTNDSDPELIWDVYTGDELEKLDDQELLLGDFREYVKMLLADYGISAWKDYDFDKRENIKTDMVLTNKEFKDTMDQLTKENKEFSKEQIDTSNRRKEVENEIAEIRRLMNEDETTKLNLSFDEMEKRYKAGDKTIEKNIICKTVAYRVKGKHDDKLKQLEEEKKRLTVSLTQLGEDVRLLNYYRTGAVEEQIRNQEKKAVKGESDWITLRMQEKKALVEGELEKQEIPASRNYAEELFNYIYKKAGNVEFLDAKKVEEILTQATKTFFFTLSKGARAEAQMRLEIFKNDQTVMNDYFIWKNNKDSKEVLIERCKVFGQESFVKKNIDSIKNIMEAIAETNACVNDMQNPRFMDELKEDLNVKGIDEKQFMFLLRDHTRGFGGKAVTKADANKADLNKKDVNDYLSVENKEDFLIKTANDALSVGKTLKLENVNEKYITEHFAECYFTANKLLAFQQLYYGEKESFDKLYNTSGNRPLMEKVRTYFDKGHGESYALYYNAVISVANKYGITEKGGLSFGLSPEEIETLYSETDKEKQEAIKKQVKSNIEQAKNQVTDSIAAMNTAYKETDLANKVRSKVSGTLTGVALEDYIQQGNSKNIVIKRDTYGLKEGKKEQEAGLEKFYHEHAEAYHQTQVLYHSFKEHELRANEVNFLINNSFQPQMLFLLAPQKSFANANTKIRETKVCTNFKNLLSNNIDNIAANLSVVDEKNCTNVINLIKNLNLDKGKISKPENGKKAIYEDDFFAEQLKDNADFYVNMVNAMNFCMIFESGKEVFNLKGYKKQIENAYQKDNVSMPIYLQWGAVESLDKEVDKVKKLITDHKKEKDNLDEEYRKMNTSKLRLERTGASSKKNALEIADLSKKMEEIEKKIKEKEADLAGEQSIYDSLLFQHEKACEELNSLAGEKKDQYRPELLSQKKLDALEEIERIFSDDQTRFMVSTYFDLFNAYLLKNGIKIDGSLVNENIYNETLSEITRSKQGKESMTRNDALNFGTEISKTNKDANAELFAKKQKEIKSGKYLNDYKDLANKKKILEKDENNKPDVITKTFDKILAKRKKSNEIPVGEFVLDKLTDEEKYTLRKYARPEVDMMDKRGDDDFKKLRSFRNVLIWKDAYERVKDYPVSERFAAVSRIYNQDEIDNLRRYNGELNGILKDAENIFNMFDGYLISRDAELLKLVAQQAELDKMRKDFSINSVD